MRNILRHWDRLKKELINKYIMLFLDYDGTLTPIASKPDKAFISQEVKRMLNELSKSCRCKLAIISGRALKDIKNIIGLKEIIYSGNHGLEIEGPKIKFESPISPGYKAILERIKSDLSKKLSAIKGIILEDKGLSLSLHFRLVDKKNIPQVKAIFHETVIIYLVRNDIEIKTGKMVLELRPPSEWDKGRVVLWLLARQKSALKEKTFVPIYIGDDKTDEDAFKALKNKGITIFVGRPRACVQGQDEPRSSYAQYYLKNPAEVREFLKRILKIQKDKSLCQN